MLWHFNGIKAVIGLDSGELNFVRFSTHARDLQQMIMLQIVNTTIILRLDLYNSFTFQILMGEI